MEHDWVRIEAEAAGSVAPSSSHARIAAPRQTEVPIVPYVRGDRVGVRSVLRWAGASVGTAVLIACLTICGTYIASLTQADADLRVTVVAIASSLVAGTVFGLAVIYVCERVYAKAVFALLALFLITAGIAMLVIAPVLRQMNTPELAEYRAFAALTWFGTTSLILGATLGLQCVRWALRPRARSQLMRSARLLGSAYGVLIGISRVFALFSLVTLVGSSSVEASMVERAIAGTAIAMWSLVPGLILTYQGISASMGEESAEFRTPGGAWAVLAFAGVLVAGGLNMAARHPLAAPMPLLHVLAAALPGLALMGFIARGRPRARWRVGRLTWRQITLAAAISMTVATAIAVYVESAGSAAAVVLLLVHNGAFKDALTSSDVTDRIGDAQSILTAREQFVANVVAAAMIAPLAGEFAKGFAARLMMTRETTRSQALLLGASAGAAFGFLEAMLYGVAGVQSEPGLWWAIMFVRAGSTSLHVFASGMVGLAWWHWMHGRARAGWSLFALAVCAHAIWNGIAVTLESRIFGLDTLSERAVEIIAYACVAPIAIACVMAVMAVAERLRRSEADDERATLAAMTPWLA